ncbi:ABC transporter permease subunit [Rhodobacteraceae bacterium KMM 6894]|nr:ABC transporter permease subunit [Rhodobacteraceae bacterium KMM 6894]
MLRSKSMIGATASIIFISLIVILSGNGYFADVLSLLRQRAGFQIPESAFTVSAADPLYWTLLAGLVNTVRVAVAAGILATVLGLVLATLRLSAFPGFRLLAGLVIEPLRNTPVVLQLFLWYGLLINNLPAARNAVEILPSVFLSNRGVAMPTITMDGLSFPELTGFNFTGGMTISPELAALVFGLTLFHASYLAEIFRAGIMSVPTGQVDAANALGLRFYRRMRLVVLPQALNFIIPPSTNQFLALVKNSSLAVAIGFPDLVAVVSTLINQSGDAVLGTIIVVVAFLGLNLVLAGGLALYHRSQMERGKPSLSVSLPEPVKTQWQDWVKTPWRKVGTISLGLLGALLLWQLLKWSAFQAVWVGTPGDCRAADGACWAMIAEKYRLILLGPYPFGSGWRPVLATAVLALSLIFAARFVRSKPHYALPGIGIAIAVWYWLMGGGLTLPVVNIALWGGLPLTIALSVLSIFLALPIGLALALARMSPWRILSVPAYIVIDIFRSVPQIFLLFGVAILLPHILPAGWTPDKFWRALFALIMITSAYLAEVFRAGLLAVPPGQAEAARSLGMKRLTIFTLVVLPQAVRIAWPAVVNTFVGAIKDTSLVFIVGLMDVLAATKAAVVDPSWRLYSLEGYCFTALIYFTICYSLARYARRFERLR